MKVFAENRKKQLPAGDISIFHVVDLCEPDFFSTRQSIK